MTERIQITPEVALPERELLQRRPAEGRSARAEVPLGNGHRRETLTYANALYTNGDAGSPLAWLNQHSPVVTRAIAKLPYAPVTAYDLGSGTGRHALTLAQRLHPESRVIAVDGSAAAVMQLRAQAHRLGLAERIHAVAADVDHFHLPHERADLIVAASALRPVTSARALERVAGRCRDATRPGGINCFILGLDRAEIMPSGKQRPSGFAPGPDIDEARGVLAAIYRDWQRTEASETAYLMPDQREDRAYTLRLNVIRWTVRRPLG